MSVRILKGDCREVLRTLPDESVHCIVTSPPYFGLRDYGIEGQIGLEATPQDYVDVIVSVLHESRRVLREWDRPSRRRSTRAIYEEPKVRWTETLSEVPA